MPQWIRADYDLGLPYIIFRIGDRTLAGLRYRDVVRRLDSSDPEKLADALKELVEEFRPELRGCTVIGVSMDFSPVHFRVQVIHPSLERVPIGMIPTERWLERCQRCYSELHTGGCMWRKVITDDPNAKEPYEILCCSEACANS